MRHFDDTLFVAMITMLQVFKERDNEGDQAAICRPAEKRRKQDQPDNARL